MLRTLAIVERELRRLRRRPATIAIALALPLVQLVILGFAIGGELTHLAVGVVDRDGGPSAAAVRERIAAFGAATGALAPVAYADPARARQDLRGGRLQGLLTIPAGYSRPGRAAAPPLELATDPVDAFVAGAVERAVRRALDAHDERAADAVSRFAAVHVIDPRPAVSYIQYLLAGSIVMSVFMMATIAGGIVFVDDKARGLHEGYLVTPITRLELIAGFTLSAVGIAVCAGMVLTVVGSWVAGLDEPFQPDRLLRLAVIVVFTALALVSLMFLLVARASEPMLPRALFATLNTMLFFPSGAVYPPQAFPGWMQALAAVNPFTYAVHASRSVLLRNTGLDAVAADLAYLAAFAAVAAALSALLFKRTL